MTLPQVVCHSFPCKGNYSCNKCFSEIIPVYFHTGADVHKGKYWDTPLHAAAQQPCTEIVNLLLEFGADINAKNTELLRPVDMATSNSAVERLLLQHEGRRTFGSVYKCKHLLPPKQTKA